MKKPSCLVVDLNSWLQPAMAYVMISRVQCLSQLFILNSIPVDKIVPWPSALKEFERLNKVCLNNIPPEDQELKIASLNTYSLKKHWEDIKSDHHLTSSDIICIQETWLKPDLDNKEQYELENFKYHLLMSTDPKVHQVPSFPS